MLMVEIQPSAAVRAVIETAAVDGADRSVHIVHDAAGIGTMRQAEVVADLMEKHGTETKIIFIDVAAVQPVVADHRSLAGTIAKTKDPPHVVGFRRIENMTRGIALGGEDILMCEADNLGDRIVGRSGEMVDNGIGGIALALTVIGVGPRQGYRGQHNNRMLKISLQRVSQQRDFGAIERTDGLDRDGFEVWPMVRVTGDLAENGANDDHSAKTRRNPA